jgi:hypothetical protein
LAGRLRRRPAKPMGSPVSLLLALLSQREGRGSSGSDGNGNGSDARGGMTRAACRESSPGGRFGEAETSRAEGGPSLPFEGARRAWLQIRRSGIRISLCPHVLDCPKGMVNDAQTPRRDPREPPAGQSPANPDARTRAAPMPATQASPAPSLPAEHLPAATSTPSIRRTRFRLLRIAIQRLDCRKHSAASWA